MNTGQSLDQRYLEFNCRTSMVFEQYPQIQPLRYFIFRELLINRKSLPWQESVKQWVRPFACRQRTTRPLSTADILIWIESSREVIVEALLPVFHELSRRGCTVRLVSVNGPHDLPPSAWGFRFTTALFVPAWAKEAWHALCEVEKSLAQGSLAHSFFNSCADVQGLLGELNQVLDASAPRVVVTASAQLLGGAGLLAAANLKGISTVLLQHGVLQPFYIPILADAMCTWGKASSDTLIRLGIDSRKLHALGSPRHDVMGRFHGISKPSMARRLSLEEKRTLVFFSNGNDLLRNGTAPIECVRWLDAVATTFRHRLHVSVRLHPNEDGSLYKNCSSLVVTKEQLGLSLVLDGCDWVASLCSTAMYEALLYGKPVWQFYADGWPELADNWRLGLATRISSQHELIDMAERMLDTEHTRQSDDSVVKNVFTNHGRATEAVADFLMRQLQ